MTFSKIKQAILDQKNPEKAQHLMRFFKTGKGEYGEGDVFLGLTVPQQRVIVNQFIKEATLADIERLVVSKYHEFRLIGLLLLIELFKSNKQKAIRNKFANFYLDHTSRINNWDLVDLSAPKITGVYFFEHQDEMDTIVRLAKSKDLWERRIAMLTMFEFIRQEQFEYPLQIAEILVNDTHDLIHKAVGWMLREIGKRDQKVEESFLKKHYKTMPRTMLRYAIERFDKGKKDFYMVRSKSIQ